jgi:hypothetical protein
VHLQLAARAGRGLLLAEPSAVLLSDRYRQLLKPITLAHQQRRTHHLNDAGAATHYAEGPVLRAREQARAADEPGSAEHARRYLLS